MGTPTFLFLVSAGAALVALASAAFTARSWPISLRRELGDLRERVLTAEGTCERLTQDFRRRVAELVALEEEIEGVLDSIEKKRKRIAASDSWAKKANGQDQPPAPGTPERRDWLERVARERGMA